MIIFAGSRDPKQPITSKQVYHWWVGLRGRPYKLPLLLAKCNHSPTGFEWGYGGDGPAQLAWVIIYMSLLEGTDVGKDFAEECANSYHQSYKWQVIAGLPYLGWQLSSDGVLDWLNKQG